MKTQIYRTTLFKGLPYLSGLAIAFCLLSTLSYSQDITVVSPSNNQTYKLPDTATLKTVADAQAAINTVETAGKALVADAAKERAGKIAAENNLSKANAMNSEYMAGINNFNKNQVIPYNTDLNNYNTSGTKFSASLASYNKAALANNALPAKDRKAATVADLTKQKVQLDAAQAKLAQWKTKLDAAKAKLDVANTALQKQKKTADAATQAANAQISASKVKLKGLLDQLNLCAIYAHKVRVISLHKFNTSDPVPGYFESADYKSELAALMATLKN